MQRVAEEERGISSQGLPGAGAQPAGPGLILTRIFDVLDRAGVEYCVLHGYEEYPRRIPSDVDCLMPPELLPRGLVELLHDERTGSAPRWCNGSTARHVTWCWRARGRTDRLASSLWM